MLLNLKFFVVCCVKDMGTLFESWQFLSSTILKQLISFRLDSRILKGLILSATFTLSPDSGAVVSRPVL